MEINFDFDKYNYIYMWDDEEYITYFTIKFETNNNVFLVCTKRGSKSDKCPGKSKYVKETGMLNIYEKCINNDFISHNIMNYENLNNYIAMTILII